MKKILLALTLATILLVTTASLALANGGPHGGFTATTDACAGCHRAHTATGPQLLTVDPNTICLSCHGAAGSGANTNVEGGIYLSTRDDAGGDYNHGAANTPDNSSLLGGRFIGATSAHTYDGTSVGAWGDAVNRGLQGAAMVMNCASCHDPHGNTNYRILNTTINAVAVTVAQVDEGDANKDYDSENWGTGQSNVCAACHGAYHRTAAGQGSTLDAGTYTHRVDMAYNYGGNTNPETVGLGGFTIPLAQSGAGDIVVCQTCHFPHGTTATMTALATGPNTADSALLRLDNRGVCEVCHQK
jgi:predicted CXXCH cytochrome family protein